MQATSRSPSLDELKLFDSCVTMGTMTRAGDTVSLTRDNILGVLDKHGIAEALVHRTEARLDHPRSVGNLRLLEMIDGMPRLHPVWALEPPVTPDPKAARAIVEGMLAAGVKVARLMMGFAPPLDWLWKDLCDALEHHRVPCFLDFGATDYRGNGSTQGLPDAFAVDQLRQICLAHPRLPMILSHVSGGLGISYPTLPLMRRVPNLHMDITSIVDYWRTAAAEIGPERVFFASGMPFYDPATLVSNVQYEHSLNADEKQLICGDNLRRLMEAVR